MGVMERFRKKAWKGCRMAFPEGEDERVLKAAAIAVRKKLAKPVLVGNRKKIENAAKKAGIRLAGMDFMDMSGGVPERYVKEYSKVRKVPPALAGRMLENPLFLAALLVRMGEADAMVAGAVSSSADVITASEGIIGLRKGVSVPSSFFIMDIPAFKNKEGGLLLFADCSANIAPGPEQLADIAMTTARTARELLGWTPRAALLSFSTKGSAAHPRCDRVMEAVGIAKRKAPKLAIDGELQGDSALVESIAKKKMKRRGKVAGRANILIFPDLDSGNIAYKLVQTLAKADAYGPILQGFRSPVSDLSRGAKAEDIAGTVAILSAWAGGMR